MAPLRLAPEREAEIIEELSQHLEERYDELRAGGLSDVEARRVALEELHEPGTLAEELRRLRQAHVVEPVVPGGPNGHLLGDLWQDLRYATRMLRKQPVFAVAAILTLALGLGANIAIFSLVYALMIRSLPVERPEELYRLGDTTNCCVMGNLQGSYSLFSFRLFEHLREATRDDFVELAAFQANPQSMAVRWGDGVAESLQGLYVSANYFQMFGVQPVAGRLLQPEDDQPSAAPVAVISHRAWTERFGQDPALVGNRVLIDGHPMTVVGIAAQGFFGDTVRPDPPDIWIPLGQEPTLRGPVSLIDEARMNWLYAIGRLRPGAQAEQTTARASTALRRWLEVQPFLSELDDRDELPNQRIVVVSAGGGVPLLREEFGQALTSLFVTSGLVLLIAAANLANLLLARADRGQAAIRAALGASTGRLLRQSLTEGVLLALVGGFIAVWVAAVTTRALIALAFPGALYVPVDAAPTSAVWLFAIGLAVVTGALFSVGPAWAMSRTPPRDALSGTGRSGQLRSFVPRRSLVVTQVALSFVLLSGAGLLASSLGNIEGQELGFEPDGRTIVRVAPPVPADERDRLAQLYAGTRDRLLRIPGVRDVSYALYSPMEGNNWSADISIAGRRMDPDSDGSSWNRVGPRYFETLGTRLTRGRLMKESEIIGGPRVALVNEAFCRRFFEDADPIGQRLGIGEDVAHAGDYEIIGVVEDVRYTAPRLPVLPMIFLPAFQAVTYTDEGRARAQANSMLLGRLIVHASIETGVLEPAIRRALAEVDRDIQVMSVQPLADQVSANFRIERLMARLTSMYGLLALALASVGLYGVTAFGVAQRTREIGVRMALGADRLRLVRTIVRGPMAQTLIGLAIGVPLALAAGRLIATQLYGVGSADPVIFGTATVVLLGSAVVAAVIPALRGASINPTQGLRSE